MKKIFKMIISLIMCFSLLYISSDHSRVEAASTYNVTVSSKNMYSYAYEVLDLVNKERTSAGLSKLTMDKDLLAYAMQRAQETSILWSHTRANGTSGLSIITSSFKSARTSILGSSSASAENIAAGQTSSTSVMTSWMNSSGHKANIMSSKYSSIGIGCVYIDGTYYWVQLFSSYKAITGSKPSDTTVNATVSFSPSTIEPTLSFTSSISKGATTSVSYKFNNGFTTTAISNANLSFTSSNTSVATVNASGVITGVGAGTATITVTPKNATGYKLTKTITVTNANASTNTTSTKNIANMTATLSKSSYTYTGSACKPSVTIRNGSTLVSSSNYTVTYTNNVNVGTATVKITGKGSYSGTITKTFKITTQSISNFTAGLSATSYTYNGSAKKPTVTLKNGSTTISNSNYTVSYSNNVNVGTATVKITGKGNYSGSITKTFKINPTTTSISSLSASSKAFTVKWTKKTTQVTGYQIQYSTSSSFSSAKTVTVTSNSTTSKKDNKLIS